MTNEGTKQSKPLLMTFLHVLKTDLKKINKPLGSGASSVQVLVLFCWKLLILSILLILYIVRLSVLLVFECTI